MQDAFYLINIDTSQHKYHSIFHIQRITKIGHLSTCVTK